ncbi:MAG: hypothetical protein WDO24_29610 [Pseudomonadota bacterium]
MTTPVHALPTHPALPGSEIIDFVAFRNALPAAAPQSPDPVANAAVVLPFPAPAWRRLPERGSAAIAADLSTACAQLVESFRAVHDAVTELQDNCRALDANPHPLRDQAGAVLMGIAALASSTERFQTQLDAAIDAAFC